MPPRWRLREAEGRLNLAFYECIFIARQDLSAPVAEGLADQFTQVLADGGGSVANREYWGLRTLAYRIRKNRKGHYILLNVEAPAAAIHEMERQMRINEDILRHMTVRVDALVAGPSAMMQSRAPRDDRHRRDDRPPRGDRDRGDRDRGDRDRGDRDRGDRDRGRFEGQPATAGGEGGGPDRRRSRGDSE
jgi:small subunit ribosomal protein S6